MKLYQFVTLFLLLGCESGEKPVSHPRVVSAIAVTASPDQKLSAEKLDLIQLPEGFESIDKVEGISLDLRYSTTNNFTKTDLYGDYSGGYLHIDAIAKLRKAVQLLQAKHPGWKLRVLDALRPREVQKKMYQLVKGTKQSRYVADPRDGSGHNYGMSVDVTLEDESGNEIDMGTPFDDFTPLAQPRYESMHLQNGKLTRQQYNNRLLLRSIMCEAGFYPLKQEWWHFNARGMKTIKSRYKIVENIP